MHKNHFSTSPTPRSEFRHDINGLRAWAVLAVILYHFNVPGFSGGFVGVDVFFVISGFLMTSIIISGNEKNSFSLWNFYLARARRIIPALVVLCAILLVIGWFLLPSADYKLLGGHASAALLFLSNIKFWREAGYFDASSHEKLLLHTWSLSVEWQFYIILPLICMMLWRWFGRRSVKIIFISGFFLSFILSLYVSSHFPSAAFYLLPCRAWEMLAGGLIWLMLRERSLSEDISSWVEKVGFFLILIAILFFDSTIQWPGYLALVPVFGTLMVLAAKRSNSYLTTNFLAREIGTWSYSIYLWHWPLVVYLNYIGEQKNPLWILVGVFTSIILGAVSYHFIECNARQKLTMVDDKKRLVVLFTPVFITIISAYSVFFYEGVNKDFRYGASSAVSKYIDTYSREKYLTPYIRDQYKTECDYFDDSVQRAKAEISESCTKRINGNGIFLWGDSHAQALSYGLRKYIEPGRDFYQVATSACQPHIGYDGNSLGEFRTACEKSNQVAIDAITRLKPDVVILAQKNNHDKNNYKKIVGVLADLGIRNIIIIGPVPQWEPSLPRAIALRHFDINEKVIDDASFDNQLFNTDDNMKHEFSSSSMVRYISILDFLCQREKCLAKIDDKNTPLVWDYGHLSLSGSEFIIKEFLSKKYPLSKFLKN